MSTYLESDLNVAAFLMVRNVPFAGLELVGTRYAFKFAEDGTSTAVEYSRGGLVPAREFADALARLKTALYAAKSNQNRTERSPRNERMYR